MIAYLIEHAPALTFTAGVILGAIAATILRRPEPEPKPVSTRIGGRRVTVVRFHPLPQDRN
jgi:hypothetical protein